MSKAQVVMIGLGGAIGTVEYWFALIKVTAIVLFIILGVAHIFGLGTPAVGFHNLHELPGGFMPHGFGGVWMAVIVGVFSFNGIEVIAVTSGEVTSPREAIPAALKTMALRLILFYVLALIILVSVVPWTQTGTRELPVRMPLFPWMQLAGLGLLAALLITMALDREFWNISAIVGVPWLAFLTAAYFLWKAKNK